MTATVTTEQTLRLGVDSNPIWVKAPSVLMKWAHMKGASSPP